MPNETSRRPLGELDPLPLESVKMQNLVLDLCPGGLKVKGVAGLAWVVAAF